MSNFSELGTPFPLFEADTEFAAEYRGLRNCSLCGTSDVHCFELDVGADVVVTCPHCGGETALDAVDREEEPCLTCSIPVPFPSSEGDVELFACYDCLRSGKAALTKDTELGMVRWEDAQRGLTHGVPGSQRDDFETVTGDDDWIKANVLQEPLLELVRTPAYSTMQGEVWQFCCRYPMTFKGQWQQADFDRHAPDGDGYRFFREIVQDPVEGLWEDQLHDLTGIYVFKCKRCGQMKAHWDIA